MLLNFNLTSSSSFPWIPNISREDPRYANLAIIANWMHVRYWIKPQVVSRQGQYKATRYFVKIPINAKKKLAKNQRNKPRNAWNKPRQTCYESKRKRCLEKKRGINSRVNANIRSVEQKKKRNEKGHKNYTKRTKSNIRSIAGSHEPKVIISNSKNQINCIKQISLEQFFLHDLKLLQNSI